jgi:hypothetical protein
MWGRNYSQFLSKILKGLPWERLGEDIFYMFLCPNVLQPDTLLCDMFPKKVVLDRNMLGLGMHHWILEIFMALVLSQISK